MRTLLVFISLLRNQVPRLWSVLFAWLPSPRSVKVVSGRAVLLIALQLVLPACERGDKVGDRPSVEHFWKAFAVATDPTVSREAGANAGREAKRLFLADTEVAQTVFDQYPSFSRDQQVAVLLLLRRCAIEDSRTLPHFTSLVADALRSERTLIWAIPLCQYYEIPDRKAVLAGMLLSTGPGYRYALETYCALYSCSDLDADRLLENLHSSTSGAYDRAELAAELVCCCDGTVREEAIVVLTSLRADGLGDKYPGALARVLNVITTKCKDIDSRLVSLAQTCEASEDESLRAAAKQLIERATP